VRLLLDTHALLWFSAGDKRVSRKAKDLIADPENELLLSLASVWEISIKSSLGKLALPDTVDRFIDSARQHVPFRLLPIELSHVFRVARLSMHHRDPFDRLLVAQALVEGVPIVGSDEQFDGYDVERLW